MKKPNIFTKDYYVTTKTGRWIKKLGWIGFFFFLIKGLFWLGLLYFGGRAIF